MLQTEVYKASPYRLLAMPMHAYTFTLRSYIEFLIRFSIEWHFINLFYLSSLFRLTSLIHFSIFGLIVSGVVVVVDISLFRLYSLIFLVQATAEHWCSVIVFASSSFVYMIWMYSCPFVQSRAVKSKLTIVLMTRLSVAHCIGNATGTFITHFA